MSNRMMTGAFFVGLALSNVSLGPASRRAASYFPSFIESAASFTTSGEEA